MEGSSPADSPDLEVGVSSAEPAQISGDKSRKTMTFAEIRAAAARAGKERRKRAGSLNDMATWFVFLAPPAYIFLTMAEAASHLWRPLSVALYGLILLVVAFSFLVWDAPDRKGPRESTVGGSLGIAFVGLVTAVVCLGQLCRHLYILNGGFDAVHAGYWHWMRLGVAYLVEAALFNAGSIFGWSITEIRPVAAWSQVVFFVCHLIAVVFVLARVLSVMQAARLRWKRAEIPFIEPTSWGYFEFLLIQSLMVLGFAMAIGPFAIGLFGTFSDGLPGFFWLAFRRAALVGLGLIIGGISLLSLHYVSDAQNRRRAWYGVALGGGAAGLALPGLLQLILR